MVRPAVKHLFDQVFDVRDGFLRTIEGGFLSFLGESVLERRIRLYFYDAHPG